MTYVNAGGFKCLKGTCQLHLQDQSERERCVRLYRHVTLKVLTEIHRWTMKSRAAWFSETAIKKLNYKLYNLFNYPASYSDKLSNDCVGYCRIVAMTIAVQHIQCYLFLS